MPFLREFRATAYTDSDQPEALALATAAGAHGVYLANYLAQTPIGSGELVLLRSSEQLVGLCLFGERGNLVILEQQPLDAEAVARAVVESGWGWRIVLGPEPVVAALARYEKQPPLVQRTQLYMGMAPSESSRDLACSEVRSASMKDRKMLMAATLDLNMVDLNIAPERVHRGWLREAVDRRIQDGSTQVLGLPGCASSKLDIGSRGPHGVVIEGVYTLPEHRGAGLAARLVASTAYQWLGQAPLVCLHVAQQNLAAQRAYRRAGMRSMGSCGLLLRH